MKNTIIALSIAIALILAMLIPVGCLIAKEATQTSTVVYDVTCNTRMLGCNN